MSKEELDARNMLLSYAMRISNGKADIAELEQVWQTMAQRIAELEEAHHKKAAELLAFLSEDVPHPDLECRAYSDWQDRRRAFASKMSGATSSP